MTASRQQLLALYRSLLRASYQFDYYNFREYFLRKTRRDFRKIREVKGDNTKFYEASKAELGVLKRQSMISQMYPFDQLVVERTDEKRHIIKAAKDAAAQHRSTPTTSD